MTFFSDQDISFLSHFSCLQDALQASKEKSCKSSLLKQLHNLEKAYQQINFDWLDSKHLQQHLTFKTTYHLSIDSTNKSLHTSNFPYQFAFCEHQNQGYGRNQQSFLSIPATQLQFSLRFSSRVNANWHQLALWIAIYSAQALIKMGWDIKIKWPNDLYLQGKKVAGILCESFVKQPDIVWVSGIGINISQAPQEFAYLEQQKITKKVSRSNLAILLAQAMLKAHLACEFFSPEQLATRFEQEFKNLNFLERKTIEFKHFKHAYRAKVLRIEDAKLKVQILEVLDKKCLNPIFQVGDEVGLDESTHLSRIT